MNKALYVIVDRKTNEAIAFSGIWANAIDFAKAQGADVKLAADWKRGRR